MISHRERPWTQEGSTAAAVHEPHPVEAAANELEALRERLVASELRASEARQEAAAAQAAMQRGSLEVNLYLLHHIANPLP